MPGARSQPRRKATSSYQAKREDSWQMLESSDNNAMDVDSTDMEADDHGNETEQSSVVDHPIRHIADRVGREVEAFAEKLDAWSSRPRRTTEDKHKAAADLVDDYATIAENTVEILRRRHVAELDDDFKRNWSESNKQFSGSRSATTQNNEDEGFKYYGTEKTSLQDLKKWQAELRTWQLMQKLLACRYPTSDNPETEHLLSIDQSDRFGGDGRNFRTFLAGNSAARERLLVLKWLEQIAEQTEHDVDLVEEQVESLFKSGKSLLAHGWLDTKEKIKSHKRLRLWNTPINSGLPEIQNSDNTNLLVTQLDEDAPTRQNRTVEKADQDFETSFWTICWEMLRRGISMTAIRNWCEERNQYARGFAMGVDPPSLCSDDQGLLFRKRFLWRRVCLQIARYGGMSDHERAVFALLGGDFEPVSKICLKWEDFLYAHFNAQLIAQFEGSSSEYLADKLPVEANRDLGVIREPLSNESLAAVSRRLISSLDLDSTSQIEKKSGMKRIQANLIAHNIGTFLLQQAVGLSRESAESDPDPLIPPEYSDLLPDVSQIDLITGDKMVLRVLTHVYLIFQDLGINFGGGDRTLVVENIVAKYITFLRSLRKIDLIPHYASHMTKDRAEYALATVCLDITHSNEKLDYLNLIAIDGIDMVQVMRYQYGLALRNSSFGNDDKNWNFSRLRILKQTSGDKYPKQRVIALPEEPLRPDELALINAGEWLLILKGNWTVSLDTLARIAIAFLRNGRLRAAMQLYEQVPFADISTTKSAYLLGEEVNVMADSIDDGEHTDTTSLKNLLGPDRSRARTPTRLEQNKSIMKETAKVYYELGQLVDAFRALQEYAIVEREFVATQGSGKDELEAILEDVVGAMDPLLKVNFLVSPTEGQDFATEDHKSNALEQQKDLSIIRAAFLPELIIAYISALHFCAYTISRQTLVQVMSLSTEIAENERLTSVFVETGRMGELVDAFAMSSKALLKLNEVAGKGKKRRFKGGNAFGIWDVSV